MNIFFINRVENVEPSTVPGNLKTTPIVDIRRNTNSFVYFIDNIYCKNRHFTLIDRFIQLNDLNDVQRLIIT